MTELKSLIKVIKEKKDFIKTGEKLLKEQTDLPVSSRRTKLGHIKRAKLDLEELYLQYRKALQDSSLFIITTGTKDGVKKFTNLAEKEFGCFSVDAESLYRDLLEEVPSRLYTNQVSSPSLFDYFASKFENRALEIDIIGYPPLLFESKYKKPLKGKEDTLELLKRAFNDKVGAEVIGLDAIDRVSRVAVNTEFDARFCAIILHTDDPLLVRELEKDIKRSVTGNVFVVTTGTKVDEGVQNVSFDNIKKVTKESVEESLLKIRENLVL